MLPCKKVPFGGQEMNDVIWGKYAPENKIDVNNQFHDKMAK